MSVTTKSVAYFLLCIMIRHGGDYEECGLLSSVHHDTSWRWLWRVWLTVFCASWYVIAVTMKSVDYCLLCIMLCHGCDYEKCGLMSSVHHDTSWRWLWRVRPIVFRATCYTMAVTMRSVAYCLLCIMIRHGGDYEEYGLLSSVHYDTSWRWLWRMWLTVFCASWYVMAVTMKSVACCLLSIMLCHGCGCLLYIMLSWRWLKFVDNWLTDGGEVVSLTHRPRYTPQKHHFSVSGTHFCQRLSEHQGHSAAGGIRTTGNIPPSGIELATFRLVAQCLNQLRYRVFYSEMAIGQLFVSRSLLGNGSKCHSIITLNQCTIRTDFTEAVSTVHYRLLTRLAITKEQIVTWLISFHSFRSTGLPRSIPSGSCFGPRLKHLSRSYTQVVEVLFLFLLLLLLLLLILI
jgi:hypothetical protein